MDYTFEQDGMRWRMRAESGARVLRTAWRNAPLQGAETRDALGKVRERKIDGESLLVHTQAAKDALLKAERALRNGRPVPMHVHVYESADCTSTWGPILPADVRWKHKRESERPNRLERSGAALMAAERAALGRPKLVSDRVSTAPKFTLH